MNDPINNSVIIPFYHYYNSWWFLILSLWYHDLIASHAVISIILLDKFFQSIITHSSNDMKIAGVEFFSFNGWWLCFPIANGQYRICSHLSGWGKGQRAWRARSAWELLYSPVIKAYELLILFSGLYSVWHDLHIKDATPFFLNMATRRPFLSQKVI